MQRDETEVLREKLKKSAKELNEITKLKKPVKRAERNLAEWLAEADAQALSFAGSLAKRLKTPSHDGIGAAQELIVRLAEAKALTEGRVLEVQSDTAKHTVGDRSAIQAEILREARLICGLE
ncbi:MAG: hypothetical protein IH587_04470 [Anaerolineae bacterium]|nr:hypothetical protein [Anaerolineae bacterium]